MSSKQNKPHGHDHFERLNYLAQVKQFAGLNMHNSRLSAYYGNLLLNVAKKAVLRVHPNIKRYICKHCKSALIEGETATIKCCKSKGRKSIKWTCNMCKTVRKFPIKRGYKIWIEKCDDNTTDSKKVNSDKKESEVNMGKIILDICQ